MDGDGDVVVFFDAVLVEEEDEDDEAVVALMMARMVLADRFFEDALTNRFLVAVDDALFFFAGLTLMAFFVFAEGGEDFLTMTPFLMV